MILSKTAQLTAVGLAIGIAGAMVISRVLSGLLLNVRTSDLQTFVVRACYSVPPLWVRVRFPLFERLESTASRRSNPEPALRPRSSKVEFGKSGAWTCARSLVTGVRYATHVNKSAPRRLRVPCRLGFRAHGRRLDVAHPPA